MSETHLQVKRLIEVLPVIPEDAPDHKNDDQYAEKAADSGAASIGVRVMVFGFRSRGWWC